MSGSGRKSAYRKGVTKKVLYGDPEPTENQQIVRVTALRGTNLFEVMDADGAASVTMLPTKFRKLIWVKRGDFLIVAAGDGDITTAEGKKGAVTSIVEHILYKDQIKSLRRKGLWPAAFDTVVTDDAKEDETTEDAEVIEPESAAPTAAATTTAASNGIQMVSYDSDDDDMFVNRNRHRGVVEDGDEDEDESDEE